LSLVIIDKLPFPSPRDPLHEARTERIADEGENSFMKYTLPLMILSLKQGFGRLIRTKTDRGVVALLDSRLATKRYGGLVLGSLPPARMTRRFADVYRFFSIDRFQADYALTVWVHEGKDPAEYQWELVRLPDGRNKSGTGIDSTPYAARWAGVSAGVKQLQEAIQKGHRQAKDFELEIRLPGIGGNGDQLLRAVHPDLRKRLQDFGAVRIIALESTTNL
jgi:ATP-dependent DNA helicase DinG